MTTGLDKKLKVLFLSQRFLFPMDTGGKLRTGNILKQLKKTFSLTVISNVESPKDDPYVPEMDSLCEKFIPVPWVEIKRFSFKWYLDILKKSFSKYAVTMLNDYSPELEKAVLKELASDSYDLAICDFMQSTLNFKQVQNIPTILFQHNVESQIPLRHMRKSKNPLMKLFWWLQHKKMFYWEKKMCQHYDSVIAVSDNDRKLMEDCYHVNNVHTIPTGVDIDYYQPSNLKKIKHQLVYVGAMDWLPNEDAMFYFVREIFPQIQQNISDLRLKIVGRNPSPKFKKFIQNYDNVEITGWVEDTRPHIAESSIFIVPIRIGGGTRMKIYEAMAMGMPVISTSIGAEGLPLEHGRHILFADTTDDFSKEIGFLLNNENEQERLAKNARQYVYENFGWKRVAEVFADICTLTLNPKN